MFGRKVKEVTPGIPVTSIKSLIRQSRKTLDVFTKTKEDLLAINAKIDKEVSDKAAEIATLQSEISQLGTAKTNNQKVVTNIERILNVE